MFDAYKVAVKLTLVNGVSAGLASLATQFAGLNRHIVGSNANLSILEKKLKSIKTLGMVGGALTVAGGFGLSMFKTPIEEAIKFDQQVQKFKLFGLGDKVNTEAVKFARGMNIMGSSYTENMKLFIEAQGVFRESGIGGMESLGGAKLAAPLLAKIAFATKSLDSESAAKLTTSSMAMLRYVEDSGGLKSPEKFKELADAGWKMVQTSGGSVNWEQLRQFKARSGVAGLGLSGDAMAMMEPIITMLKGQTAGFSLRTAYNRLNGIVKIPNQVAHELVNSGIWDGKKVNWNSQGGIKSFNGNPLRDAELFASNPIAFYEKNIMPMYAKRGLTTDAQIGQQNAMLFGSTGGNMFTLAQKNMPKLHQSLAAQNRALGIDASYGIAGQTAEGKMVALTAQWSKAMTDLGIIVLPTAIKAVTALTNGLQHAINFAQKFPTFTKVLVGTFAALSVMAVAGGTLMLATAGFKALGLALAFNSIGGGAGLMGVVTFIGRFASGIMGLASTVMTNPYVLAITGAAAVGYGAGTLLNKGINAGIKGATGHDGSLGTLIYDWTHTDSINTVKPGSKSGGGGKGDIYMDGRKVGEIVTNHQTKSASKPFGGQSVFDMSMSPLPPGMKAQH